MNNIGKEYGTAMFALACESSAQDKYADALALVRDAFEREPEYGEFLSSPSVSLGDRLSTLDVAFADKVPEDVLSFLKLLCEKRRMFCLAEAIKEYMLLLDASRHVSLAKVTSAIELTDAEKQKLMTKLEAVCGGKVNAEYSVDAALLGGLIVEIDGKVMDGTLRQRLRDVKEVMNT